jgi:hypothetical protein
MSGFMLVGAMSALAGPVHPCSCVASGPPCTAAVDAHAVFAGEVTQTGEIESADGSGYRQRLIHFRVLEKFQGVEGETVEVVTGQGGGDCGYGFRKGGRYLVYGYRDQDSGHLYAGICSRTQQLTDARSDLEYLRTRHEAAKGAGIEGRIIELRRDPKTNDTEWRGPLAGAQITVEGEGQRRESSTDREGEFRIWGLPDGEYSVTIALPSGFLPLPVEEVRISRESCGWVYHLATPPPYPR